MLSEFYSVTNAYSVFQYSSAVDVDAVLLISVM
jgi:hypothetical protein